MEAGRGPRYLTLGKSLEKRRTVINSGFLLSTQLSLVNVFTEGDNLLHLAGPGQETAF